MRNLLRRLQDENGIALVLALSFMIVLSLTITTTIFYSTQSGRESVRTKAGQTAYSLAEAGINNAVAVLGLQTNVATDPTLLPSTEQTASSQTLEGGTAKWWGTLNTTNAVWTLHGKGFVVNPNVPGAFTTRTISASVQISASLNQPLNTQAWNYWYATNQGGPNACDVSISNNVEVDSPFYIQGNLCLSNNAKIVEDLANPRVPIIVAVLGKFQYSNGTSIGRTSTNKVTEVHIAGGCGSSLASVHACKAYPTSGYDPIYTNSFDSTPVDITPPVPDWSKWYTNASPGPQHACNAGAVRPPVFDNNSTQDFTSPYPNGSVTTTFDLTPSQDYSCTTSTGQLSWNASTKTLTVKGVIYIDGSAAVTNAAVNDYQGQATMLLSGSFSIDGKMCGKRMSDNSDCDFAGWNPNTEMLIVAAHATGNSVFLDNSAKWQGGVWGTNTVYLSNNAVIEGPTIGGTFNFSNNAVTKPFPTITSVPLGAPGNPTVYAQPNPPSDYSG